MVGFGIYYPIIYRIMKFLFVYLCLLCFTLAHAQMVNHFQIDLTKSKKGKLSVSCDVPDYKQKVLKYQIPRAVPGSYSIKNYGNYVSNFKAYDLQGHRLKVSYQKRDNAFTISKALNVARLTYDVRDTWRDISNPEYVFQPGGTYFEPEVLYCLNAFALFGYFEGYDTIASEIRITKSPELYCSTSANITRVSATEDVVKARDYDELQDNPLVYLSPDTVSVQIKNCCFRIAVFSRNHKITAPRVLSVMQPILSQVFASSFELFPVSNYTFTFICPGWQDSHITAVGGMGAMEHRKNSVYFFAETGNDDILNAFLKHVVTHEFLHVITPLSLKSEQIYRFNYQHPEASQHLWLYEGAIEYLSNVLLFRNLLSTPEEFWNAIRDKSIYSSNYKNVSMTEFSKTIFQNTDSRYYLNVYNKGALVAFLLDIRINELTGGRMNLLKVLFSLERQYRGGYFRDGDLFNEIVRLTHPDVRSFIDDYIVGTKDLPVAEYLKKIGYNFNLTKPDRIYTFGRISLQFDGQKKICEVGATSPDFNIFHLNQGDGLVAVNDTLVDESNYYHFAKMLDNPKSHRVVTLRYDRKGELYEITSPPLRTNVTQLNYIETLEIPTDEQLGLRKIVLGR